MQAACVDAVPAAERSFLPLYYLAWFAAQRRRRDRGRQWLAQAAETHKERVFASRPEEVEILRYAVQENPADAQAHLQLGCLLANLGRVDEASAAWQTAAELDPQSEHRLAEPRPGGAQPRTIWPAAEASYRKAIAARPERPDAVPRPGRNPDRRRPAAGRDPAVGGDADCTACAGPRSR